MIVSHQHRFIFLHSRKTAGSAVTLALLQHLTPDDWWLNAPAYHILSEALQSGFVPPPARHPAVREALAEQAGARFARRAFRRPARLDQAGRRAFAQAYNSCQLPYPKDGGGWQHVGAASASRHLGPEVWNSYFKFAFERNPWDRMVSLYWWRMRREPDRAKLPPFREFIEAIHAGDQARMRACRATKYSNWHIYTIDDEVAVDYLGRYESLAEDLRFVREKVGLPATGGLPRSKHQVRRSGLADLHDPATIRLTGEVFHREIALLGYQPPARSR
jgi:hypothetical protein